MTDKSLKYAHGIVENVLVKIREFFLPADFVILDMEEDENDSIILERPFLATERALIDVEKGDYLVFKGWNREEGGCSGVRRGGGARRCGGGGGGGWCRRKGLGGGWWLEGEDRGGRLWLGLLAEGVGHGGWPTVVGGGGSEQRWKGKERGKRKEREGRGWYGGGGGSAAASG
nr:acanthoscurrin-2-like [Arachis hypogaea]